MVEDWFDDWRRRLQHRIRDPKGGWPEDPEYWEGVIAWMSRARVRQDEGDALLDRLQEDGLPYGTVDNLIQGAKKALNQLRKDKGVAAFEGEAAAKECRRLQCECGGMGLVSRDHFRADYGLFTVSYYCPGPMGRHLAQAHRTKKLPELATILGSRLEYEPDDAKFIREADPRHVRIGRFFSQRGAAAAMGRPGPQTLPEIIESSLAYQARQKPTTPARPVPIPPPPAPEDPR